MIFLLNFLFNILIMLILAMNFFGFGGVGISNLCKFLPVALCIPLLANLMAFISIEKYKEKGLKEWDKQAMERFIKKYSNKKSKIKYFFNFVLDGFVLFFFALNGFIGNSILFVLMNFLDGVVESSIQEEKWRLDNGK